MTAQELIGQKFKVVGEVIKPHSYKGEMILLLNENVVNSLEDIQFLFLEINLKPVPFFIERFKEKQSDRVIVKFEDVETDEAAENFRNAKVYLPERDLEGIELIVDAPEFDSLIGYQVIDKEMGSLGTIESIMEMPQQEIATVIYKGKEILLPLNEATIIKVNKDNASIDYRAPEGLIEMYLE